MSSLKELQRKRKKLLLNLDEKSLERYIQSLSNSYYTSLLKEDHHSLDNVIDSLNELIFIYEFEYPNIHCYINHCLVIASNEVLSKVMKANHSLFNPIDESITNNEGFNDLSLAIDRSLSKKISLEDEVNMKELYQLCSNDANLDENIVSKVNELYHSFLAYQEGENKNEC